MLTGKEYIRYSRQIMLEEHGEQGQERLKAATALIIGLGGLGCPVAQYLTASGVGHLVLVDNDKVETTNLHRQILYTDEQVGVSKVEAAKQRLTQLNPNINIDIYKQRASSENLTEMVSQADVILDCTDNIDARYSINKAAFQNQKKLVSGSAIRYEAQIISFDFSSNQIAGCYQCLVPDATDDSFNCATSGVLGPVLGIAGSMQALSAIKAITGHGFVHNLWQCFDGRNQQWVSLKHKGSSDCPVCYRT